MFYIFLKKQYEFSHLFLTCLIFISSVMPIKLIANDNIEIIYYGHRDEMAFIGLGQGLEDSSEKHGGLKFRLNTELENFRPYKDPKVDALFVSMGVEAIRILSMLNPQIPIFNLVDDSEEIRSMCLPNVFHLLPSKSMRGKAISEWKQKNSDESNTSLDAKAWDPTFNDGKAYVLNIKFKEKRSIELSEQGWAGWVAATALSDALVKSKKDNSNIIDILKNDFNINVYKGIDSHFGKDGQLKQIVLIKNEEKVVGQIPVKDSGKDTLDSIVETYCQ